MEKIKVKNHKKEPHSRHSFEVEIADTLMQSYFNQAYERLASTVEIKGFRKGFAPKLLTIKRIGQELYFQTALDIALPDSYYQAISELEIRPISNPEVSIQSYGEGAPLIYRVSVDVLPKVEPGNYHQIRIRLPEVETKVSSKEVEEVIERLRKQQARLEGVNRPIKNGDRVDIDYVGEVKGVKKDDLSSKNFPLIVGSRTVNQTLEESLVGKKSGETYSVEAKIDRDLVVFQVSIHSVAEVALPEVDKKFSLQFGRKDPDDLRTAIREQLGQEKLTAANRQTEEKVLAVVVKKAKLEVPRSLIEKELDHRVEGIKQEFGVIYPKFLEQQKKNEAELRKSLEPQAETAVKTGLVIGEIAKREGISGKRPDNIDDMAFQKQIVREVIDLLITKATKNTRKEK